MENVSRVEFRVRVKNPSGECKQIDTKIDLDKCDDFENMYKNVFKSIRRHLKEDHGIN